VVCGGGVPGCCWVFVGGWGVLVVVGDPFGGGCVRQSSSPRNKVGSEAMGRGGNLLQAGRGLNEKKIMDRGGGVGGRAKSAGKERRK